MNSRNIISADLRFDQPLILPKDEVQLWRADLDAIGGFESRWQRLLPADESARAARFHFAQDRQRFVAARAMLRTILGGYLETCPESLSFSYSKREKPSLGPAHADRGVMFNISHSGGIALLAFTRRRDIGVDVEFIRKEFDLEAIARRYFSEDEQNQLAALPSQDRPEGFFRCWTRKEAYIKATGDGLSLPLRQFDVSLAPGEMDALKSTRPDGSEASRWLLQEVPAGPGYAAALCVRGHDWKLSGWPQSDGE